MKAKIYMRNNWLGILGLLVGLLGVSASFYFFNESQIRREPSFLVDPVRTEILSTQVVLDAAIKVLKSDGSEITSDLHSIRFYFWNAGQSSIKKDNILKEIKLTLDDNNGEILDYKLLRTTRDINNFRLMRDSTDTKKSLVIDFLILEHLDGAVGQIIYEGNAKANFITSGVIEGVKSIRTTDTIVKSIGWFDYIKSLSALFLIIIIMLTFFIAAALFSKLSEMQMMKKAQPWLSKLGQVMPWFWIILAAASILYILIFLPMSKTKQKAKRDAINLVPSSLRFQE